MNTSSFYLEWNLEMLKTQLKQATKIMFAEIILLFEKKKLIL